jgi:pimeloyl-ACP methyl ester carboxylesterase
MRKILYIHGAFSSGLSFQRIQEKLPRHDSLMAEYTVEQRLDDVIAQLSEMVSRESTPVDIVSHSLGGIIGVAVAKQNLNVRSILTMSTPFGGSKVADLLRWISPHELYRSLQCNSSLLQDLQTEPLRCKHRSVITTVGNNPMMYEPNDGVVSLKSQLGATKSEQIKVPLNHFEVLMSDTVVSLIKDFTFK